MTTWFVSRHEGALHWMREHGPTFDHHVPHLNPALIQPHDTVIGTLPVNLAAQVCEAGARYIHLSVYLPVHLRGKELSAAELQSARAHLQAFNIQPIAESQT